MIASFVTLGVTGLPMKFHDVAWLRALYGWMGGLVVARTAHRAAAVAMTILGIAHLAYLFALLVRARFHVRRAFPMIPTWKDARDIIDTTKYYFGIADALPEYDRFNFREKFDYFAVFWGLPIMVFSGVVLWFPVYFGNHLPDLAIGVAMIAHSDEALLAISAIVLWHFYNVHFNPDKFPMSWVWLHGRIYRTELRHEHPLEYARMFPVPSAADPAVHSSPIHQSDNSQ